MARARVHAVQRVPKVRRMARSRRGALLWRVRHCSAAEPRAARSSPPRPTVRYSLDLIVDSSLCSSAAVLRTRLEPARMVLVPVGVDIPEPTSRDMRRTSRCPPGPHPASPWPARRSVGSRRAVGRGWGHSTFVSCFVQFLRCRARGPRQSHGSPDPSNNHLFTEPRQIPASRAARVASRTPAISRAVGARVGTLADRRAGGEPLPRGSSGEHNRTHAHQQRSIERAGAGRHRRRLRSPQGREARRERTFARRRRPNAPRRDRSGDRRPFRARPFSAIFPDITLRHWKIGSLRCVY